MGGRLTGPFARRTTLDRFQKTEWIRQRKLAEQQLARKLGPLSTQMLEAEPTLEVTLSRSFGQEKEFALDHLHLLPDVESSPLKI